MKTVVYLTRHTPGADQIAYWTARGYTVRTTSDTALLTFTSGAHAWACACQINDAVPNIVVGVIPVAMLPDYLRAADSTPLLRAMMKPITMPAPDGGEPERVYAWTGAFERIVKVEVFTTAFDLPLAPPPDWPGGDWESGDVTRRTDDPAGEMPVPAVKVKVRADGPWTVQTVEGRARILVHDGKGAPLVTQSIRSRPILVDRGLEIGIVQEGVRHEYYDEGWRAVKALRIDFVESADAGIGYDDVLDAYSLH